MGKLNRRPPASVRRQLRREAGFGCPVANCGNPYLEYHHFDPEWHERPHHEPEGMIALCATHHAKAGAWTAEQCREIKQNPHTGEVSGRFEWMRREIVAIVGGNYYHETPHMVVVHGEPVVWFDRDESGYLLLNVRMWTISGEPRTQLISNDWEIAGGPTEVESPPNGSYLRVRYSNGDDVQVRFREWRSPEDLQARHPVILRFGDAIAFPLVTAEVQMAVGGTDVYFDAREGHVGGMTMVGNVMSRCDSGLVIG